VIRTASAGAKPMSIRFARRYGSVRTAEGARRYAEELQLLLRAIGASDADMERGQLRVEANVSIRRHGNDGFGTRVEVKNMNSFRSVERAIAYEIERQAAALDGGETLTQDTRGWDEERGTTYVMRSKEDSQDYRYFPEPDLPPLRIDGDWLATIRAALPELPAARRARYEAVLGLSSSEAAVIVNDPGATLVFEALRAGYPELDAKRAANWVVGEYLRLKRKYPEGDAVFLQHPGDLAEIVRLVVSGEITAANGKDVFEAHFAHGTAVAEVVQERGYRQISDAAALASVIDDVLAANPTAVADIRAGRAQAIGFLVGQVMKATRGQANAAAVQAALRARLE
jgi:aspartyl-tRNA(Asn)/glutamyl-tRNA(Gln) amidotransferase subunit B